MDKPGISRKTIVIIAAVSAAAAYFLVFSAPGRNIAASLKESFLASVSGGPDMEVMEIPPVAGTPEPVPAPLSAAAPAKPKPASVRKAKLPVENKTPAATSTSTAASWCPWKTFGAPSGDILINEIAWMGTAEDPEEEWLEFKNVAGRDVDTTGYQLLSRNGNIRVSLAGKLLKAGDFYLLARRATEDILPDQTYSGSLSNAGEWLKLFDTNCRLTDEVDARNRWPDGSAAAHLTLERKVGGGGWQSSAASGGSPGKQNNAASAVFTPQEDSNSVKEDTRIAAPAKPPLIVSVRTSGTASDDDSIKIWNPNAEALDISGWKLRKRTKSGAEYSIKTLAAGSEIAGGGLFVWANSKYGTGADATSTQTISDDNSVALLDGEDKITDALAWGSGHASPYIEGMAFPENPKPGQSVERVSIGGIYKDTRNNAADFGIK